MNTIDQKYNVLQGSPNFPGAPLGPEVPATGGGLKREYERGSIYWKNGIGAFEVHGAIRDRWLQTGAETFLGYPLTDETTADDSAGRYNDFEHGSIYWSPETGAHEIYGDIRHRWVELGGERSVLGYPTTGEVSTPNGTGRYSHFQGGSIYCVVAAAPTRSREQSGSGGPRWIGRKAHLASP